MSKTVIICGAGCTLSDASKVANKQRPPLDRGFFQTCRRLRLKEFDIVKRYLNDSYVVDVCQEPEDSLEKVMAILYADVLNPATTNDEPGAAFRALLGLINRRIADATNRMTPTRNSNLYRIIRLLLLHKSVKPSELTLITFNYDLHIERTLDVLQRSSSIPKAMRPLMTFPHCYRLEGYKISNPPKQYVRFDSGPKFRGIEVLKLHGSLNWFSVHDTADPTPQELIRKDHNLWITPRQSVATDMTIKIAKESRFTFPLVVPPVVNKAAILHTSLGKIWRQAIDKISSAATVIVFGYSCPQADQESANLISRRFVVTAA